MYVVPNGSRFVKLECNMIKVPHHGLPSIHIYDTHNCIIAGIPVDVDVTMHIVAVSSISEVDMVSKTHPDQTHGTAMYVYLKCSRCSR